MKPTIKSCFYRNADLYNNFSGTRTGSEYEDGSVKGDGQGDGSAYVGDTSPTLGVSYLSGAGHGYGYADGQGNGYGSSYNIGYGSHKWVRKSW